MASGFARSDDFKTPDGRLSFADSLFKARPASKDAGAKLKYGCTLIFTKEQLEAKNIAYRGEQLSMYDIVERLIIEQWGEKGLVMAKSGLIKSPFLAGDGKEARSKKTGELHGGMGENVKFIRTTANDDRAPQVFSNFRMPLKFGTPTDVYSGCHGYGIVNAFCWNNSQNGDGVSIGITAFYKKKDDTRLGNAGFESEAWAEGVEDAGAAPEATKTGAGAAGLFGGS